jgi:arginyl-tRNA synthetase
VDRQSPLGDKLTIKQALLQQVQAALSLYILNIPSLTNSKSYIPLQLSRQQEVVYSCAIAFKLSSVVKLPAIEVAESLSQLIDRQDHQQNLMLQVVPPGWICLKLTQPSLAAWLQRWVEILPLLGSREQEAGSRGRIYNSQFTVHNSQLTPHSRTDVACNVSTPTPESLFPIQYAHARCCSLLRMAHREKIIIISSRYDDINASFLELISPQPIPWLSEAKLCLHHPDELNFLTQLVAVLDDLYCPNSTRQLDWLKVALNLSQAFQTFYSQCRIWGEVKSQNLYLAQARLGLVAIAQSVFRILLVDVLSSFAPLEL